jgi:hypothetical protein
MSAPKLKQAKSVGKMQLFKMTPVTQVYKNITWRRASSSARITIDHWTFQVHPMNM